MTPKSQGTQLHFDGIDPDPTPTTIDQAQHFLRKTKWCVVEIILKEDHDKMRLKISAHNPDADKGSYSDEAELPLNEPAERDRLIIRMAALAHTWRKKRLSGEVDID